MSILSLLARVSVSASDDTLSYEHTLKFSKNKDLGLTPRQNTIALSSKGQDAPGNSMDLFSVRVTWQGSPHLTASSHNRFRGDTALQLDE